MVKIIGLHAEAIQLNEELSEGIFLVVYALDERDVRKYQGYGFL